METDLFYGDRGPTQKQSIFRDSTEKFKLFGGGLGGGKSWALCADGIRLSAMYPGNRGFMLRAETKSFKTTTLDTLLKLLEQISMMMGKKIYSHNKSEQKVFLFDRSVIIYGGLNDREDKIGVKSLEIGWFAVDEANECSKDAIEHLEGRLRWTLPDGSRPRYFGMYASNPEPCFIKDLFVTPQYENRKSPRRIFVQALVQHNRDALTGASNLPEGYREDLMDGKAEWWIKRYIEGSWDAAKGLILDQFNPLVNVIPNPSCPIELPLLVEGLAEKYPLVIGGMDHGIADPTCFLGSFTDYEGNLFIYDEYYSPGMISEHSKAILRQFYDQGFTNKVADPSIWSKTGERKGQPWSVHDEYGLHGLDLMRANNDFALSIDRLNAGFFFDNSHEHPLTNKMGSPRTFISARCKNLIREIGGYVWGKGLGEEKEKPKRTCPKHAIDAARYIHNELEECNLETENSIPEESVIGIRNEIIFSRKLTSARELDYERSFYQ